MNFRFYCLLATLLSLTIFSPVRADILYGLTANNGLVRFDSASPGTVTFIGNLGAAGMRDIDFHAANGQLYGMTGTGTHYQINVNNASVNAGVPTLASLDGSVINFDFNPAADRMRVFTNGTTSPNNRIVPDFASAPQTVPNPGGVIADGLFSLPGYTPVAAAYTNPFDNAASATLYSIGSDGNLYIHSVGPQFGTVTSIGSLGLGSGLTNVGFDISQSGSAFASVGDQLYTVNLATGVASSIGSVTNGTGLVSIAAVASVPEPSSAGLLGVLSAAYCLVNRRRK